MKATVKRDIMSGAFLEEAGPGKRIRAYSNKEVIFAQGSPANCLFYVQNGMVMLSAMSNGGGKKAVLALLQEGDLIGEGCLGRRARRTCTATSVGLSTLTRMDKAAFLRQVDRDRAFADMFIVYLIAQSTRFKADLVDHFLNFSKRRLARILLMHKGLAEGSDGGSGTIHFSQTALAEMVGTTRGRVSSFMNEFRKKGYVRYNGCMEINVAGLTAFLQG